MRRHWLYGDHAVPIERHSMLSNGSTVALLAPDAKVTWLCHPRPDSAAIFADILGGSRAGYFSVTPGAPGTPARPALPAGHDDRRDPLVGRDGDRLARGRGAERRRRRPATTVAASCSTLVRVLSGSGVARLEFAPRPEFGQVSIRLQPLGDGLLVLGSNEPITLFAPGVEWDVFEDGGHDTARAVVDLAAPAGTVRSSCASTRTTSARTPTRSTTGRRGPSSRGATGSAGLAAPRRRARRRSLRSALTLRGLCHEPTGSILAAATTSLPEELGGVRNWDYRYCWLRDAAMSARVLVDLGSLAEAEAFLHWVDGCVDRTGGHPERLHPLYTVEGLELGPEAVIETLPGYAGSRPVRDRQRRQPPDPARRLRPDRRSRRRCRRARAARYGRALARRRGDGAGRRAPLARARPRDLGGPAAAAPPRLLEGHVLADRRPRARGAGAARRAGPRPDWVELRECIRANVLEHGWNEAAGAYSVAYGDEEIDASSLWIGLSGLLADDDPRFLATVLKVEAELRSGAVVYRYRWDDGLPGTEGGFHICTAWLIEAYLRTGRRGDAEELFQQMLETAGPTGLLPEQYDPFAERGLGNHPQAYSHLGLIRCAAVLSAAGASGS